MQFTRDYTSGQFKELSKLYDNALVCLNDLRTKFPEYEKIWKIVQEKLQIIKKTIDNDEVPNDNLKRDADMSTMLTQEFRDVPDETIDMSPLFRLDKAYTLLGMKDIKFKIP